MHTSLRAALFALSSTVVVACSGAAPDASEKSTKADGTSPYESTSDSKGGDGKKSDDSKGDPGSGKGDPAPSGGSCPKIEGTYEGPVTGRAALLGDDLKDPVDGAARVTFAAGSDSGSFAITDGAIDVTIKTVTSIRVALEVAGDVKCGKLDAKLSGQAVGQGIHGTATCTMTDAGCKGEWEVSLDSTNKLVAKGEFDLEK